MDQVTGISADRGREAVEDRLNYELDLLKKYAENGRIIIEFDNSVGVGTDYGEDYAKYLELTTDEGKVLFFKWWGIKGNVVYESACDWSTELEEWESPLEEIIVDYIMEAGGAEIELTDEEDTLSGLFQLSDSRKIADYNEEDTGWYEYDVYDYDGNVLMNGFDTEKDAIEYAETHPEVCGVEGYWVDEDGVQNTWSVWEEGEYKPDSRYYQEQLKTK